MECAASNGSPPLISTPFAAPTPVPTITAVGVARPSAHGHATTCDHSGGSGGSGPARTARRRPARPADAAATAPAGERNEGRGGGEGG